VSPTGVKGLRKKKYPGIGKYKWKDCNSGRSENPEHYMGKRERITPPAALPVTLRLNYNDKSCRN